MPQDQTEWCGRKEWGSEKGRTELPRPDYPTPALSVCVWLKDNGVLTQREPGKRDKSQNRAIPTAPEVPMGWGENRLWWREARFASSALDKDRRKIRPNRVPNFSATGCEGKSTLLLLPR
ncbi:hypothetical protein ZHAS_00006870 [Anopheles sinensis]|uniref:Uncharacterized protein n=1 Tax=Anopheles sinensis TaxID=74873 RepID=A0A084VN78_ANOSI|nr:hypothetical protein ZHAS_00006870 [Anopheles sinensis]